MLSFYRLIYTESPVKIASFPYGYEIRTRELVCMNHNREAQDAGTVHCLGTANFNFSGILPFPVF